MGLSIFETLNKRYGDWVEGVTFTLGVKEALAVGMKRRMEERKMRIPDTPMIRNSFRSVKKTVTATGQARFDAEHDAQFGHADAWWAACLAESAASQPGHGLIELWEQQAKALQAREVGAAMTEVPTKTWATLSEAQKLAQREGGGTSFPTSPHKTVLPFTPEPPKCPRHGRNFLAQVVGVLTCGACGWSK